MVECIPETPAVRQQKQGNQKFKVIFSYRDREQLDTWNPTPKTSQGPWSGICPSPLHICPCLWHRWWTPCWWKRTQWARTWNYSSNKETNNGKQLLLALLAARHRPKGFTQCLPFSPYALGCQPWDIWHSEVRSFAHICIHWHDPTERTHLTTGPQDHAPKN